VVWLQGDVERLVYKVEAKGDRPPLASATQLVDLMNARQPYYRRAATLVIDIEGKRREEIAWEIVDRLGIVPAGSP
jgi:shikimate kinase